MPRVVIKLNSAGMAELLNSPGVGAMLQARAERVLAYQQATVPVATGELQSSLEIQAHTTDRTTRRIGSFTSDHVLEVQSKTGFLTRSVDAAGGA